MISLSSAGYIIGWHRAAGPAAAMVLVAAGLGGCNRSAPPAESWDHAETGLYAAAISEDGRFAALASVGQGAGFWDLEQNEILFRWGHGEQSASAIEHIDFSPDGEFVVTAERRMYTLWSTRTGKPTGNWSIDVDIKDVAVSDGGRHVLLGLADGRALHFDVNTNRRLEVIAHRNEIVSSVDLSADGSIAVTGGHDHRTMVWDSRSGDELGSYTHASRVTLVRLDPDSKRIFSSDNLGNAVIWEVRSGAVISRLELSAREYVITAARFSFDSQYLVTGFPNRRVSLWAVGSGTEKLKWYAPSRKQGWKPVGAVVDSVAFAADGRSVLAETSAGQGFRFRLGG